jgi:hypothetical protein
MIEPGTKKGDTLRTPPAAKSSQVLSIIGRPPIPNRSRRRSAPAPLAARRVRHRVWPRDPRRHAVMDEYVHPARLFQRKILANVETPDFSGDSHRKGGGIEARDRTNPRTSCKNVLPGFGNGIADGRNDTEASDDDSATCQLELRRIGHAETETSLCRSLPAGHDHYRTWSAGTPARPDYFL